MLACDILLIGQFPPPLHGLSAVNLKLEQLLSEAGFRTRFIDTSPSDGRRGATKYFWRVIAIARAAVAILARRSKGRDFSVYMSGEAQAGIYLLIVLAAACRLAGVRFILHHHNFLYVTAYSRAMQMLLRVSAGNLTHIFLCMDMQEQFFSRYESSHRQALVLSNALFVESIKTAPKLPSTGALRLGMMSNLTFEKGVDTFLKIGEALLNSGHKVEIVLAGPASSPQVESYIRAALERLGPAGCWLGTVQGEAKAEFFRSTDLFVFPTRYKAEAQPLVLLEALQSGCPILSTDIACIGCDHSGSPGMTASPTTFADQAEAWIEQVLHDPGTLIKLRVQAVERFEVMKAQSRDQFRALLTLVE